MAERAQRLLDRRRDPRAWVEANLFIRDKDRRVIPFRLNPAQVDYHQHRTCFDAILKPRQLGFTTQVCGLFFADTIQRPNTTSVIVAHDLESTKRIFRIVQLFWERLPEEVKRMVGPPSRSNRREFFWPRTNSHFYIGTAGSLSFGRGMTINNVHASELAFWPRPEEALIALTEAVPQQGGQIIIESTANGVGNFFHDFWVAAKEGRNGFKPQFYVWWEDPTYRIPGGPIADLAREERELKRRWGLDDDQMRWRRAARQRLGARFIQEYPEDETTCFLTSGRMVFDLEALQKMAVAIAGGTSFVRAKTLPDDHGGQLALAPATLLIWRQPERDHSYVIGADVGEGLADGDASCGIVLDRETGEQVAELHARVPPERFAHLLHALAWHYRRAMLAVERNNHGHSVLNTLRNVLRYPLLYHHVRYDHRAGDQVSLGWPTDQSTKPILVDDLAAVIAGARIIELVIEHGLAAQALVEQPFHHQAVTGGRSKPPAVTGEDHTHEPLGVGDHLVQRYLLSLQHHRGCGGCVSRLDGHQHGVARLPVPGGQQRQLGAVWDLARQ